MNTLTKPNQLLSDSVLYRQEIDLRIGCSFTIFQTLELSPKLKRNGPISYGPCQFPTLGFVVERHLSIINFVSEPFYYIKSNWTKEGKVINFNWCKDRLYDKTAASVLYINAFSQNLEGQILSLNKKNIKRYKPKPLATIELTKIGTSKLKLSSHKIMELTQKLYQKGFVSYPRTQTDIWNPSINLIDFVKQQTKSQKWGAYAAKLVQGSFSLPRNGKNDDKAHPPIHPVKHLNPQACTQQQFKVYQLIARHFLASCSTDAQGQQTQIISLIGNEKFNSKGSRIINHNFLDVYIYDKWLEHQLPKVQIGEKFTPDVFQLAEGKTTPPNYLTQAELIGLMDKYGIGTDSTIHQHIETIQKRGFATKTNFFFKPTQLGTALVKSYKELGFTLSFPELRANMQEKMKKVAAGQIKKETAVKQTLEKMIGIFDQLQGKKKEFVELVVKDVKVSQQDNKPGQQSHFGTCSFCDNDLQLVHDHNRNLIKCQSCELQLKCPQGQLKQLSSICKVCKFNVIEIKKNSLYKICPYCYNNPKPEMFSGNIVIHYYQNSCYNCMVQNCQLSQGRRNIPLFKCTNCSHNFIVKTTKKDFIMCGCSNYPNCKICIFMPKFIKRLIPLNKVCQKCNNNSLCRIQVEEQQDHSNGVNNLTDDKVICVFPGCNKSLQFSGYNWTKKEQNKKVRIQKENDDKKQRNIICFICNQVGHIATNCPNKSTNFNKNSFKPI